MEIKKSNIKIFFLISAHILQYCNTETLTLRYKKINRMVIIAINNDVYVQNIII